MKRCPTCQSIYTDDSLSFCLQDGARLQTVADVPSSAASAETLSESTVVRSNSEPPTEVMDLRSAPTVKINAPVTTLDQPRPATNEMHARPATPAANRVLTTGVIAIALLLLALVGIGLVLLFRDRDGAQTRNIANPANANANGNTQTTNSQADKAQALSITGTASSTRAAYKGITYGPANALDGLAETAWMEGVGGTGVGEWIRCDFGREVNLRRIIIAPGYFKSADIWARNNRLAAVTLNFSDGSSRDIRFPDRMQKQTIELEPVRTAWVRIVIKEVYTGDDPDTAISDLSFDWE